jgi:hypothetical protein
MPAATSAAPRFRKMRISILPLVAVALLLTPVPDPTLARLLWAGMIRKRRYAAGPPAIGLARKRADWGKDTTVALRPMMG